MMQLLIFPSRHSGAKRSRVIQQTCSRLAAREMGHLGSNVDLRRFVQRRQHLQLAEARLHLLGESSPWAAAGFTLTNGDRHHEVLLLIRSRSVRLQ